MAHLRLLFTTVMTFVLLAAPGALAQSDDDASIELHWRDCATIPEEDVSWFDHCHDGPWRASVPEDQTATFTQMESGESYTGELDDNGDLTLSVPPGTYSFQPPPIQDAEAIDFVCSYANEEGEPEQQISDPTHISIQPGNHVICDFFVVWGEDEAGVEPLEPEDPQGIIELRWRACEEASTEDELWVEECFDPESDNGTEPQENRRVTVHNADDNTPWTEQLDEDGNTMFIVPPGSYTLSSLEGDFVTADFKFCSEANEAGTATNLDIETDPVVVEDEAHIICDYYYVAE